MLACLCRMEPTETLKMVPTGSSETSSSSLFGSRHKQSSTLLPTPQVRKTLLPYPTENEEEKRQRDKVYNWNVIFITTEAKKKKRTNERTNDEGVSRVILPSFHVISDDSSVSCAFVLNRHSSQISSTTNRQAVACLWVATCLGK